MQTVEEALDKLETSRFRAGFHLTAEDRAYYAARGEDVIRAHARDFVASRLAPDWPANDGRQTPMRGHPVFKAMHATACCCRGCLNKWYKVPKGRPLTPGEQERIVNLLMAWIRRQLRRAEEE